MKKLIFSLLFVGLCLVYFVSGAKAQSSWQGSSFNNPVAALALQDDGKIIVGGPFTSVGGHTRRGVARLNADGTVDLSFLDSNVTSQGASSVAMQQDGKILAAGNFNINGSLVYLVRLNQDGSHDLSFNAILNGRVWSVVPQLDGTIYVGGEFTSISAQTRTRLARLNPDGSLDQSFQDPGIISTLFSPAVVYAITPSGDGKVLVGGYFDNVAGQTRTAVTRINSDGTLDLSFQDPGLAGGTGTTINHNGNQTIVNSLAIQGDGNILIGGAFNSVGGQTRNNLARLGPDGSLDLSFQNASATNTVTAFLRALALQPDGRVLIAGFFNSVGGQTRQKVARVNPDGTLDQDFIDPAVAGGDVLAIALQTDGKLLIGGTFTSVAGRPRPILTRLTSTGTLDVPLPMIFTVTKTADTNDGECDADCSLREAIAAANASESDDTIEFDLVVFGTAQTISLTSGQLAVCNSGSLTVNGTGHDQLVISGNNQSRIMRVFLGGNATLNDLTIANGNGLNGPSAGCPIGPGGDIGFGGGGIESRGTLFINNSVVRDNVVSGSIGGISNAYGTLTITNSTVRNNRASTDFGGIGNIGSGAAIEVTATIINSNITNNEALLAITSGGGGIGNTGFATLTLIDSTVTNNTTAALGGGIRNVGAILTINNSTVSGNTAEGGAGIANSGTGTTSVSGSSINNNIATGFGGGIQNLGESIILINSTISGNSASLGGGIFGERLAIVSSTIAFNRALDGGGIVAFSQATSRSSIIGNNTVAGASPDLFGSLTSQGYNLIGNTSGVTIIGGSQDLLNVDPMLDPRLLPNGGSTLTHALRVGSPAIDQGGSATPALSTDQRALSRPYDSPTIPNAVGGDGSDVGAFERQSVDVSGVTTFDYDGDGKSDISVFRPADGNWYLQQSTDGFYAVNFGVGADKIVPADYDGDGKADVAVYRPSTGIWYVVNSSDGTFSSYGFGIEEDLPAPADYDGDGKADISVFRPSTGTWYRQNSIDGSFTIDQFGTDGDVPTIGDFDGDGKSDVAVFRPSDGTWYQLHSSDGSFFGEQFGIAIDKIVPADYDGDGKTDIAIYRPADGLWYVKNSGNGTYTPHIFGIAEDIPVPGDYDGDGKADIAVFRPSNGHWYISNSSNSSFTIFPWGQNGDRPTSGAFGN